MKKDMFQKLLYWIEERYSILLRRRCGSAKPWTQDTILQSYRFCNVYREDDTVTQWIHKHWLKPNAKDPDVWFAMAVARLVNWPDTLEEIGYPVPWNPKKFIKVMHDRKKRREKVFSGAYIVSTNGNAMDKAEYLATHVLTPLWRDRNRLRPQKGDTLNDFHERLMQYDGMGSFIAAQVIADTKHVGVLKKAKDWKYWAASGPGSRRGLNRVIGLPPESPWLEDAWRDRLMALHTLVQDFIAEKKMPFLDAQNLQNCLCEFDKYMRTKNNEGRPRSKYPGAK